MNSIALQTQLFCSDFTWSNLFCSEQKVGNHRWTICLYASIIDVENEDIKSESALCQHEASPHLTERNSYIQHRNLHKRHNLMFKAIITTIYRSTWDLIIYQFYLFHFVSGIAIIKVRICLLFKVLFHTFSNSFKGIGDIYWGRQLKNVGS